MNIQEMTEKRIKINICSLITDLSALPHTLLGQKGCAPIVKLCSDTECKEYDECIEFSTEGILKIKGNTVEITYKENENLGMSDIESTLRFKKTKPSMINLIRRGTAPASLIFDTDTSRRNCSYSLGNLPFSFCICTNSVVNICNDRSGKIILDYEIEIHGMKTEHNIYTLEYKE